MLATFNALCNIYFHYYHINMVDTIVLMGKRKELIDFVYNLL